MINKTSNYALLCAPVHLVTPHIPLKLSKRCLGLDFRNKKHHAGTFHLNQISKASYTIVNDLYFLMSSFSSLLVVKTSPLEDERCGALLGSFTISNIRFRICASWYTLAAIYVYHYV